MRKKGLCAHGLVMFNFHLISHSFGLLSTSNRKRIERAESWNCERGDAVRQSLQLQVLQDTVVEQLEHDFD